MNANTAIKVMTAAYIPIVAISEGTAKVKQTSKDFSKKIGKAFDKKARSIKNHFEKN